MERGIVKVLKSKGFGFIEPELNGPDIFFHASALRAPLEFGDALKFLRVEYDLGTDPRTGKLRAISVRPASN